MKNKELKKIAKKYGVNVDALKEYLIGEEYELDTVIEVMYENAQDLLYCRLDEMGGVEYADKGKFKALLKEYKFTKEIQKISMKMIDDPLAHRELASKFAFKMFKEPDWGIEFLKEIKTDPEHKAKYGN